LAKSTNVHPYLLAVLLCDVVINEEGTGKKTIVGTFDKLSSPSFPAGYPFTIYVKITDAEGVYRIRLDYVSLSTDRVLASEEFPSMAIPNRLEPADLVFKIVAPIPEPGSYEFRIYVDNAWLCRAPFTAALTPPQE
jgi:hypothetical protein